MPGIVEREGLLDAAERMIAKVGIVRLTLDAVAREGGISRRRIAEAGFTKTSLVSAVIERLLARDDALHATIGAALHGSDSRTVDARVAAARLSPGTVYGPAAPAIGATVILNDDLRRRVQRVQRTTIETILVDSSAPRGALLAYLATEGLKLLENLDFHRFDAEERRRVLAEIAMLSRWQVPPALSAAEDSH